MELTPRSLLLFPLALALSSGADSARAGDRRCDTSALTVSIERLSESHTVFPHGTVVYAVDVADPRPAGCEPSNLLFQSNRPAVPGFSAFVVPTVVVSAPGAKQRAIVSVTPTDARPGDYQVPLNIRGAGNRQPRAKLPVH